MICETIPCPFTKKYVYINSNNDNTYSVSLREFVAELENIPEKYHQSYMTDFTFCTEIQQSTDNVMEYFKTILEGFIPFTISGISYKVPIYY